MFLAGAYYGFIRLDSEGGEEMHMTMTGNEKKDGEKTELFTRSYNREWNRIVNLVVLDAEKGLPYISDASTYKILLLKKGTLKLQQREKSCIVPAPAVLLFDEKPAVGEMSGEFEGTCVFFCPAVVNDGLGIDVLRKTDFSDDTVSTTMPDYYLVEKFLTKEHEPVISRISVSACFHLQELIERVNYELVGQRDGFWPCRSRSCFIEILFYLNYSLKEEEKLCCTKHAGNGNLLRIIQYMNENIQEKITMEDLEKISYCNRNRINEMFHEYAGMTCMNYFQSIRMNLAKSMIGETELPIGEIARKVGYPDANYFTKVFKKITGVTPMYYRKTERGK